MKSYIQTFKVFLSILTVVLLGYTQTAHAATIFGEVDADAGTYTPFALGQDLELNACGSSFSTYNLCSGPDLSGFLFSWQITPVGGSIQTIANIFGTAGAQYTVGTGGIGDVIQSAGVYTITLNLTSVIFPFNLGDGNTGMFDFAATPSGNSDSALSAAFTINPVSEPLAIFLLIPAAFFVARRQKKLRLGLL